MKSLKNKRKPNPKRTSRQLTVIQTSTNRHKHWLPYPLLAIRTTKWKTMMRMRWTRIMPIPNNRCSKMRA